VGDQIRGVGRRAPCGFCELLIAVSKLHAGDDEFAIRVAQPLEGRLIPIDGLSADCLFER
jgi:hypothetical protein